ncbi:hypothetical protein BJX68DRAFT_159251 [Aspergillus pseudodeflectus]|uniref:Uncharacterized protein n=1 Tax=Aspergillus pseudodeflectus TaxID=176178 RepID=A0ABR4JS77_9EURO
MSSRQSPEEYKQSPHRLSFRNRIRAKTSSFLSSTRRFRKKNTVDSTRGADEAHLEDEPTSSVKRFQKIFRHLGVLLTDFKPTIEPLQSRLDVEESRERGSDSSSDSAYSARSDTQASTRSNSQQLQILVQGCEGVTPEHALGMCAFLDTGCAKDLMAYRHFLRLKQAHGIELEESNVEVMPLNDRPMEVYGIARGLLWQLDEEGFRTYTSDFYIVDMDQFDVLISWETARKYNLLDYGADIQEYLMKVRERKKHRRKLERKLRKAA